jgi:hydrogenase maturation protease
MTHPRIAVIGMGNVLMSDDAAGPHVIETLNARFELAPGVEAMDLGTPGLDLTPYITGLDTLILVDTVLSDGLPGELRRYEKPTLMNQQFRPRVSPHDPALAEALTLAELAGACPRKVVLIGIIPENCDKGTALSPRVRRAIGDAVDAVIRELRQCDAEVQLRRDARRPNIWWEEPAACMS